MIKYEILKPIWNTESVGIAARRIVSGTTMEVTIAYKDAKGELVYPYRYQMACRKMLSYPTQTVRGTVLHVIPIADFEVAS